MRPDAYGFFWQDLPQVNVKGNGKEKVLRQPPAPVWLEPGYLPGLEEAKRFPIVGMSDEQLVEAWRNEEELLYDTECYPNYWCCVVRSFKTGRTMIFEQRFGENGLGIAERTKLKWILENFCMVSFNGIKYDLPMCALACEGIETDILWDATKRLIEQDEKHWQLLRSHRVKQIACNQIDLMEVAPLIASLKAYGGRMHVPRMQDLPFPPGTELTDDQIAITRWYCVNDTTSTGYLRAYLKQAIELRYTLSNELRVDVRSKSDAQIAEATIGAEYERLTGRKATRPIIPAGTVYRYERPATLFFQTQVLKDVLAHIEEMEFVVGPSGKVLTPPDLKRLKFQVGASRYKMGMGGLHSLDKGQSYFTDGARQLIDADVESYYPKLILLNRYFPPHLGELFLTVFGGIVDRRLAAKHAKNKPVADSLKIVINGTFGKLLNQYSIVYAPKLGFHVTIGGQLFLLMLAEALELAGIPVVSGNTDGIMLHCPRDRIELANQIIKWWEGVTGFKTEGKNYRSLHQRDINNYIAISEPDEKGEVTVKHKGAYYNPWNDPKENKEFCLKKNPMTTVCIDAVDKYLLHGTPFEKTIRECRDITQFTAMVKVGPGAVKDGEYLGKQIRWYYSEQERGREIVEADSGYLVGSSTGGKPCLQLPDEFPSDIDYEWYDQKCRNILEEVGMPIG